MLLSSIIPTIFMLLLSLFKEKYFIKNEIQ